MKNKFLAIASLTLFLSITSCTIEVREDNDIPKSELNPAKLFAKQNS